MKTLQLFQVFCYPQMGLKGNTSTVLLLDKSIPVEQMQHIAADLCQPATTFLFPTAGSHEFEVRWFAPDAEIHLCGHGSLAAIAFLADHFHSDTTFVLVHSNGRVRGRRTAFQRASIVLEPIEVIKTLEVPDYLKQGLGVPIVSYFETDNKNIVLLESENDVRSMRPDFEVLRQSATFGYAVTAKGSSSDFVSRTLVPHVQQLEDPATGSSHAALVPFWARMLKKTEMTGLQLSKRGGYFECELVNNEVILSGHYNLLASGNLTGFYSSL